MKKYIYILLLVTISKVYSQKSEIFTDVSFGTFTNLPLKDFHNDLADYGFTIGFKVNKINTTFFYNQKVAGSKSSLADYSGYIKLTNEIKGSTFGAIYEKELSRKDKKTLHIGFKGLLTFSNLTLANNNLIANTRTNEIINFKSTDFGAGLLFTYRIPISFFIIRSYIGADIYLGGKLKFKEISGSHLTNKNGNALKTGWTGINGGLGIAIPIL